MSAGGGGCGGGRMVADDQFVGWEETWRIEMIETYSPSPVTVNYAVILLCNELVNSPLRLTRDTHIGRCAGETEGLWQKSI